jgi:hypothetical protein
LLMLEVAALLPAAQPATAKDATRAKARRKFSTSTLVLSRKGTW